MLLDFTAFATALLAHELVGFRRGVSAARITGWGLLAVLLGLALAAPAVLPLLELAKNGSSYKSLPVGEQIWQGYLHADQRVLPLSLFAPRVLTRLRGPLWPMFPRAFAPTVGVLGLVLAVAGAMAGGLDLALFAVLLLGIGLATDAPGLGWLHWLPFLRYVLPTYGWPLVAVPLTQCSGRAVEELATPAGRRRALSALVLVLIAAPAILLGARFF